MITLPMVIHIIILLALAFRIMLFAHRGRRRPVIAWLAYVIMVAAFTESVLAATGNSAPPGIAGIMLEFFLALAVYCHRGNVAELFKSPDNSRLGRWLCWSPGRPAQQDRRKHQRRKTDKQQKVTP